MREHPRGARTGSRREAPRASVKRRGRSRLCAPGGPAMMIERDVPVPAGDGVVLRADVFRPEGPGRYPVILSYGPYAKGLAFQEGYADQWRLMTEAHRTSPAGRATSTR